MPLIDFVIYLFSQREI